MKNSSQVVRKYIFRNALGDYVGVRHGQVGFEKTSVMDQDQADEINRARGFDLADIKAAEICFMGGKWCDFWKIKASYNQMATRVVH